MLLFPAAVDKDLLPTQAQGYYLRCVSLNKAVYLGLPSQQVWIAKGQKKS